MAVLAAASVLSLHLLIYGPAVESLEGKLGEQDAVLRDLVDGLEGLQRSVDELEKKVESLEDEVKRLRPLTILMEYSGISRNMTFAVVLDEMTMDEGDLVVHDPRLVPQVRNLGRWSIARGESHILLVVLDGEVVLESRFLLEAEGCLVVTVSGIRARLDLYDECPLFL